jgi:hypothetical protein
MTQELDLGMLDTCPSCGNPGVAFLGHTAGVGWRGGIPLGITHPYEDNYDPTNPAGTCGSWLEVPLEGEACNCALRLVVGFHKGAVHFSIHAVTTD